MSVRRIPKNHIHVTGRHAAQKSEGPADFESLLEADHLLLLDHDLAVRSYDVQPVVVPVEGVPRGYVPDALVNFQPDADGVIPPPELREVKSTLDLEKNEKKYARKFEAAHLYCEQRGWVFRIITEKEIRIPLLDNVKFVRAYVNQLHPKARVDRVISQLEVLRQTDFPTLLNILSTDEDEQLEWMPVIWHLVAKRQIGVNWDESFRSAVPMWTLGA